MGNNICLKYSDLAVIVADIQSANTELENAVNALKESTDLGSSIIQAFWKFGNKEAIFEAIRKATKDIKIEIEQNQQLIKYLNGIGDIYEAAGSKSKHSNDVIDILKKIIIGSFVPVIPNIGLFSGVAGIIFGSKIVSKIKSVSKTESLSNKTTVTPKYQSAGIVGVAATVGSLTDVGVAGQISQHMDLVSGQCLDNIWREWGPVSPNGFTNYNGKGNCTWYADQRWSQMNPENPLVFNGSGGNAKNWINSINKEKFNVLSTSDVNNIKGNAVAVSQKGYYGHVAYIEQVKDGMVFYTEDGESYTRPHTWDMDANGNWVGPRVQSCTLEEFKYKFGNIITSK